MDPSVGHDWERLPPLETSRRKLALLLQIEGQAAKKNFVETGGRKLREMQEKGIPEALQQHPDFLAYVERDAKCDLRVPLWEQLAKDLSEDSDFCSYVRNTALKWLRTNDELKPHDVILSFAHEGYVCTVDCAQEWYDWWEKELSKDPQATWIMRLSTKLGRKPISRLSKELAGGKRTEGELRKGCRQKPHAGRAVTDVTSGDDRAAALLLDQGERAEEIFRLKELLQSLDEAVARLPDRMRVVLTLRYLEGNTLKKIGDFLGLSEARIRQLEAAALAHLKRILNPSPTEDRP